MPDNLFASPLADERRAFLSHIHYDGPTMPHMDTPCHIFGTVGRNAPKRVRWMHRKIQASHMALILAGQDPSTGFVLHLCDNPECVRVDHLVIGTAAENGQHRRERGTSPSPSIMHRWHAERGHPAGASSCTVFAEHLLRRLPDAQVAKELRVSLATVKGWRRQHGIPKPAKATG